MPSLVGDGVGRHSNANLHLFERLLVAHDNSWNDFRLRAVKSVLDRLHVLKMFGHQLHELLMLQVAGSAND
jgi:hypothetical protein